MRINQTKLQIAQDTYDAKQKGYIPVKEFSEISGLSKQVVYNYIKNGTLEFKEFGSIIAIKKDEAERIKKILGK